MIATNAATRGSTAPPTRGTGVRWWWISIICVILFAALYYLAVWTPTGQSLENAALTGATEDPTNSIKADNDALRIITVTSLAVAVAVLAIVGLLRRSWHLAVAASGTVVVSVGVAEVLKHFILPRPNLLDPSLPADLMVPSYPSGHTTIAMSLALAALIVVPYRWRGFVMFFVVGWAVGIGALTTAAHWHRLSDTWGAAFVALTVASLFSLWLLKTGHISRYTGRALPVRTIYVVLLVVTGLVAVALGILLVVLTVRQTVSGSVDFQIDLYQAAHVLAYAGSVLGVVTFWGSWRRLESVGGSGR